MQALQSGIIKGVLMNYLKVRYPTVRSVFVNETMTWPIVSPG